MNRRNDAGDIYGNEKDVCELRRYKRHTGFELGSDFLSLGRLQQRCRNTSRLGVGVALPAVCTAIAQSIADIIYAAPDDHLAIGPDCRVTGSYRGSVSPASSCPTIRVRIVFCASIGDA